LQNKTKQKLPKTKTQLKHKAYNSTTLAASKSCAKHKQNKNWCFKKLHLVATQHQKIRLLMIQKIYSPTKPT
jgi:hypothetical protein